MTAPTIACIVLTIGVLWWVTKPRTEHLTDSIESAEEATNDVR